MQCDMLCLFRRSILIFCALVYGSVAGANTIDLFPEPTAETSYLIPVSAALEAGDPERAERMLRTRLEDAPEDSIAWEALGVALALQGDVTDADAAYARAVEIEPFRLSAWVKRGDLAEAAGDFTAAFDHWRGALDVQPTYRPANERLGRAHAGLGDLPQAISFFEAAVAVEDPDTIGAKVELALIYNLSGRPADTFEILAPWDASDADPVPAALLALGNAYAQTGDPIAALDRYDRGLAADPDNMAIARAMGALLLDQGEAQRATDLLAAPAAAEPVDAFANLAYARALASLGQHAEAVTAAERVVAAGGEPDLSRQALSVAARSHLLARDFPMATATSARLIALFPANAAAWRDHAAIVAATGQYDPAREIYDEALTRFADDPQLLRGRSLVHIRLENLQAASEDATRAADAAPTWLEPRVLMGEIARARGRPAQAEAAFRQVLAINPDHWPSLVNLADLAQEAGELRDARDLAERAVVSSGGADPAQDILAEIEQQLADP